VDTAYNFGCLEAIEGHKDHALNYLALAVDGRLSPQMDLEKDTDLTSLHGDPRFDSLLAHAKEKAAQGK